MAEQRISELVKKAKGEDRSLREYERDSGVDAAVISKIINGSYIPKKKDVYRKLTSPEASPRGGVTYEQMIKAADTSKSYHAGMVAGMAVTEAALLAMGGVSAAALGVGAAVVSGLSGGKLKGKKGENEKKNLEVQRFIATTNGILLGNLGSKGISFQIKTERGHELENKYDTFIEINDQKFDELILRYLYLSPEEQQYDFLIRETPRRMVEELVFLPPSSGRIILIITNCSKSYDYLLSYKNKIAFDGNLSVVLADIDKVKLVKEDYIAHFRSGNTVEEFYFI